MSITEQIIAGLVKTKTPSILLIFILFHFGAQLISSNQDLNTTPGVVGVVLIALAILLLLISFIDIRFKEHVDHTMKTQESTINNLSKALKITSKTHTRFEKNTQKDLGVIGARDKQYMVEEEPTTADD